MRDDKTSKEPMMARLVALMFGVLALAACSSDDTTRDDSGEIVGRAS